MALELLNTGTERLLSIQDATDLYLPYGPDVDWQDRGRAYAVGSEETHSLKRFDAPTMELIGKLIGECKNHAWDKNDPNAVFVIDNIPFRVHFDCDDQENTQQGSAGLYIVRKGATSVPGLDDLHLPPWWSEVLSSPHLNSGGLVILSGSTGVGKTTLLYSTVQERLRLYAGHARSIENPVELRLNDWDIGKGLFVQTEPRKDLPYKEAMERALDEAMRGFPSIPTAKILMLGEMRHPVVAAGALTAADSGHLVCVSSHGTTLITAVRRFASYAGYILGYDLAREMMGGTLRAVFHQKLRLLPHHTGFDRGRVEGKVLLLREASDDEKPGAAANIIADAKADLSKLNQEIVTQGQKLKDAEADLGYRSLSPADRRAKFRTVAGPSGLDILGGSSTGRRT
jgi:Tfp pilus assembly pilus retraction ATPase PilT